MKTGSCHCGAVQFTVDGGEIGQVMECNCSHCRRKGFLLWFLPRTTLAIQSGQDKLTPYFFNKHHIKHQFCAVCGCQPFELGVGPDGRETAAINVRCLDGVELEGLKRVPFNGRDI